MKKKAKRSLNQHQPGCGPYTPGVCCRLAQTIKEQDPLFHEAIVEASTQAPARTKRPKASVRTPAKIAKKPRKAPKGERGIRSDSHIGRLKLAPSAQKMLETAGQTTLADVLKHTKSELSSLVGRKPAQEIEASLKRFGKQLAKG